MRIHATYLALCLGVGLATPLAGDPSGIEAESEAFLSELVGFESTEARPQQTLAALESIASRLRAAGFADDDIQILNPLPNSYGLLVRYRGAAPERPIAIISHVDVVPAVAGDWSFPPFTLGSKDGRYLGRGVDDNKAGIVQSVGNFLRLKREGWVPRRDVLALISGDEETSGALARWAAGEGGLLAGAAMVLNTDAGSGEYDDQGTPRVFWLQTSEKLYQTYRLTTHNQGGHSSAPRADNAIRDLARAIVRIGDHQFPLRVSESTRLALQRSSDLYEGRLSSYMRALAHDPNDEAAARRIALMDPSINTWLRTTCVPTMLEGGHAENALPREASVLVQCRIMPGIKPASVQSTLENLVDGLGVSFEVVWDGIASDESELPDALLERFETLVHRHWPDIPVIPSMSSGATDGLFFRNAGLPVYGMSALFYGNESSGAHGLDEHIGIEAFHRSMAFWYDLIREMGE